jgi:hypothetical protein
LPLERPLWSEPIGTTLDFGDMLDELSTEEAAINLNGRSALAFWQLEERVNTLLQERTSFTLPELVEVYPPEFALEELVAYLSVGMKSQQHIVDKLESIKLDEFLLPQITFQRDSQNNNTIEISTTIEKSDV